MSSFNSWIQGIIVAVVITTIIEMILPNGNNKKYVKMMLGVYVVFSIISPIINKITNNQFELTSIINIDKYKKEFETMEANSKSSTIEETNYKNINSLYISSLEKDMKSKLKDKGYRLEKVQIDIENDGTYQIKKLKMKIVLEKNETKENNMNISIINEIKIDNIEIGRDNDSKIQQINSEEDDDSKSINYIEKRDIIKFISDTYGVNENKITIY